MKKLFIIIAILLSFKVQAQDATGSIRKTPAGLVYGLFGTAKSDIPIVQGTPTNGQTLIYNFSLGKYVPTTPAPSGVTSFNSRTGAISPLSADYSAFYPLLLGTYNNPTWLNQLAWSKITGAPTALSAFTNDLGNYGGFLTASSTNTLTNKSGNISQWTNDAGYITSVGAETDPVYSASSWFSTTNNSANWNTAYGWGDHAGQGYLTSTSGGGLFLAKTGGTLSGQLIATDITVQNGIYMDINTADAAVFLKNAGNGRALTIQGIDGDSKMEFMSDFNGTNAAGWTLKDIAGALSIRAHGNTGQVEARSFYKTDGTSSQYLMADGSVINDADLVHKAGTESITGAKTFSGLATTTNILYVSPTNGIRWGSDGGGYSASITSVLGGNMTISNSSGSLIVPSLSGSIASFSGTVTAPTFSGALSGNATTATTATNSTQWGGVTYAGPYATTASLANYLPLTGGTLTGNLTMNLGAKGYFYDDLFIGGVTVSSLQTSRKLYFGGSNPAFPSADISYHDGNLHINPGSYGLVVDNNISTPQSIYASQGVGSGTYVRAGGSLVFGNSISAPATPYGADDGIVYVISGVLYFKSSSGTVYNLSGIGYLPLTGGTLSGALNGTSLSMSGAGTFGGSVTATGFFESSDLRYKDIISRTSSASGFDMISFKWKPELKRDSNIHYGYVAQDVRQYMPDQVNEDDKGYLSVNYTDVLVKKVSDLEARILKLEKQ